MLERINPLVQNGAKIFLTKEYFWYICCIFSVFVMTFGEKIGCSGTFFKRMEYVYMMIVRVCQLIGMVCLVSVQDLVRRPVSPKKKREKAQKEMQRTLGYLYQESSLQVG